MSGRGGKCIGFALAIMLIAALSATTPGCGKNVADVYPLTTAEKSLAQIAGAYLEAHGKLGRGPKNIEELKPFLEQFGKPDELLISPNDKEPYVIIWGADPSQGGRTRYKDMYPIIAYEKKGTGGKRAITDIRGLAITIPESDMDKLVYVRGQKPG